jgi:hypothetical protein
MARLKPFPFEGDLRQEPCRTMRNADSSASLRNDKLKRNDDLKRLRIHSLVIPLYAAASFSK